MKILVFGGAGKIGSAVAWDLIKADDVETVGLVGRTRGSLEQTKKRLGSKKIAVHALDITKKEKVMPVLKAHDVGVVALPDRRTSYAIAARAIEAGLHIVDMLEEYHRRPDVEEIEGLAFPKRMSLEQYGEHLHRKAVERGVTFLDGIGFAPGLSNITVGEAIRKLDVADSAVARVGGIPAKEAAQRHPLRYMITWAFSHVLREYMIKVKVRKGGKTVDVNATTDREQFRFSRLGRDEELECAVTPGMPSFIYTRSGLRDFAEKTIRWPGHWHSIDTLKECGLLDLKPVRHNGGSVVPREFLLTLIEPRLKAQEGETDVCVMWNTVKGTKDGQPTRIDYYMWEEADRKNRISAMARVTGYPSAIGALMIGRGEITARGIVPPEDAVGTELYPRFMEELKKRNITILEETSRE
jgi:saccharopine dehydrogenase-like NADP-dependent oxidoreductase